MTDTGPFVMSRYLNKEDLYKAMSERIERLEKALEWLVKTVEDDFAVEIYSDAFRKKYWEQRKKELDAILTTD